MVGQRFEPLQGKGDAAVKRALSGGQILGPWFEGEKKTCGRETRIKQKKKRKKKAMACGRLKNTISHSDAQITIKTEADEANEAQLLECIKIWNKVTGVGQ